MQTGMNGLIPLQTETVVCLDNDHCHRDPHQDIMTLNIGGHTVKVESERGSFLYSVWIDGDERGAFITSDELDQLIKEL